MAGPSSICFGYAWCRPPESRAATFINGLTPNSFHQKYRRSQTKLPKAFSYLLGHCRGLGRDLLANVPENYDFVKENAEIAEALHRIERELDALWNTFGAWPGFLVFDELFEAICEVAKATTGLWINRAENRGMHVGLIP
jgi:hypothetical protein